MNSITLGSILTFASRVFHLRLVFPTTDVVEGEPQQPVVIIRYISEHNGRVKLTHGVMCMKTCASKCVPDPPGAGVVLIHYLRTLYLCSGNRFMVSSSKIRSVITRTPAVCVSISCRVHTSLLFSDPHGPCPKDRDNDIYWRNIERCICKAGMKLMNR